MDTSRLNSFHLCTALNGRRLRHMALPRNAASLSVSNKPGTLLPSVKRLYLRFRQADASKADQQELLNVEGRLINYLVDCITSGRERDQAYAAVLLARLLTHVRICRADLAVLTYSS